MKDRRAFDKKDKDLFDFAHSYLSEAFPNPDREGCPPDSALLSLAFNPWESEPIVTEHLAACSPCFNRYGELLAELKSQRGARKGFSWVSLSIWTRAHPVLAGAAAICLLFIAIGAGFLLHGIRQPNASPMETNRKSSQNEPRTPTVAYLPLSLDLTALSPVRGSEPSPTANQLRVPVPNSTLDLTLILPVASPEVVYDLKLAAENQTLWSKFVEAHLRNGKTVVQVEVDFGKIPPGNYDLKLEYSTSIRLIQPVAIQAVSPTGGEQKP